MKDDLREELEGELLDRIDELEKVEELNAELLEALKDCAGMSLFTSPKWDAAIAKAEGGVERGYHKDGSWRSTIIAARIIAARDKALNAELLEALKKLRDDESMPRRFLPEICTAIAKAEDYAAQPRME